MNNKKIAKARFNVIDLVIVVAVIACVAGVCIRHFTANDAEGNEIVESAQISFLVQDIRYTSAAYFVDGDNVYTDADGVLLGKLMRNFEIMPAEKYITDANGKKTKVNYPADTRIDVRGKILSEGQWKDDGFMVGGNTYIAAGKTLKVCTPHVTVSLIVTDVTKNSDT